MPVTFHPAQIPVEPYPEHYDLHTPISIFGNACRPLLPTVSEVLQSSFQPNEPNIVPVINGFVHTIIQAYNGHHALIIRPDDVWIAILVQFSFFVNANAEALRSLFVSHEGKRELTVTALGNRYTVDFGHMAKLMTQEIDKNVIDPLLRAWILPKFTTTTSTDIIVSSIVMMATMKKYFDYKIQLLCGIPCVTLEGEKQDWEKILERLETLKKYGPQTETWYNMLHSIISRFVKAFDDPEADDNLQFWGRVAHYEGGGSGPTWLSGWITAFCVFDEQGKWLGPPLNNASKQVSVIVLVCSKCTDV